MSQSLRGQTEPCFHVFDPVMEMCGCGMGRNGQMVDWNANRALSAAVTRTLTLIQLDRATRGSHLPVDGREKSPSGPVRSSHEEGGR